MGVGSLVGVRVGSLVAVGSLVGMGSLVEYLIKCKNKNVPFHKNIALYKKYLFEAFCTFEIQGFLIYELGYKPKQWLVGELFNKGKLKFSLCAGGFLSVNRD